MPNEPFVLQVGWGPVREVQVGVETVSSRSIYWQLLEDHAEELGAAMVHIVQEGVSTHVVGDRTRTKEPATNAEMGLALLNALDVAAQCTTTGLWTQLGREECNRLIRLLRRARDSAFGRDE